MNPDWVVKFLMPSLELAVKGITGVAATTIAIYVAKISKRQADTAREKLRLDLYEHRYAIYKNALAFRNNLLMWDATEEQQELAKSFVLLYDEARFMFPPSSGVADYLNEMHRHAFFIVKHESTVTALNSFPGEQVRLSNERDQHLSWLVNSIPHLVEKMAPHLNFHVI
jgi:hypothetical protein